MTSGGVTETATVNVTVNAVADIADDSATTNEDTRSPPTCWPTTRFEGTPAITAVARPRTARVVNDNARR